MTQEEDPQTSIAATYKQIADAEAKADQLELMLDALEARMDALIQEADEIPNSTPEIKETN